MSDNLKYTKEHEWLKIENGNVAVLGITPYAQDALGDLVFVELPEVGRKLTKGEHFAVVNLSRPPQKSTLPSPAKSSPSTTISHPTPN